MAGLSQDELKALVLQEMRASLGYNSSKLSGARTKAEYYYLGQPIGDLAPPEIEGRSSVVSTDIRDTIESMLPQLMATFAGSDTVVDFEPTKPNDEASARQATEYINHLFYKQNNGHKIAYTWMKDALLQKNGIVKCWWDERSEEKKEEYRGLTPIEVAQTLDDDALELISQNSYPDEDDAEMRREAISHIGEQLAQAQQAAQQGNAQAMQAAIALQAQIDRINQMPVPMLYDIVCKRIPKGRICIDNVPPEEFLISRDAKDIQTARFVGHRVRRTRSELKSMGYKNVDNISAGDESASYNMERLVRLSWNDEMAFQPGSSSMDDSQVSMWVTEAYIKADYDGDGIAELRKVTIAGNEMLDNEETDYIPFVSITPVPLPHTFFGLSIADLAFETQRTKTNILRAQLDNLYLQVNGRYFAVEGQVNLDDLLTSRPGGVVRIKNTGAVGRLDQGMGDMSNSMGLMEYMQTDLENRTGWSRRSMGNNASGQQMTATAANIVTNREDMRVDLIARNFSEGFTELFKLMLKLVSQYQQKEDVVKLTGGWIAVNPTDWRNEFGVNINVGLGMGNKDQKVSHIRELIQVQQMGLQLGFATPENLFNSAAELARLLGYKNADKFLTDPAKAPPKPPQPQPEMVKAQAQMAVEKMKIEMQTQADREQRKHEAELELARAKMQAEVDRNRQLSEAEQQTIKIQQEAEFERMKAEYEDRAALRDLAFQEWKTKVENETKFAIAELSAKTTINTAKMARGDQPEGITELDAFGQEQPNSALSALVDTMNTGLQQIVGSVQMQQEALLANQRVQQEQMQANVAAIANQAQQNHANLVNQMNKPKVVKRGPDGKVIGVI